MLLAPRFFSGKYFELVYAYIIHIYYMFVHCKVFGEYSVVYFTFLIRLHGKASDEISQYYYQ